jgi:hypothetical protein
MRQFAKRFGPGISLVILGGLLVAGPTLALAGERATDARPAVEVAARAEGERPAPNPEWGTSSLITYVVPAYGMQSWTGSPLGVGASGVYSRYSPTMDEIEAPVQLPTGALITAVELQGCDSSGAGELIWTLSRIAPNGTFTALSPVGTTGAAATPGCGYFSVAVTPNETVDNDFFDYQISAANTANTNTLSISAVRVYYRLQESPGPGTATFGDVPTSSAYFKFVEALYAAGIVSGCGGGNYCPGNPVTRGQLAVFLVSALGMHYPY